MGEAEGDGTMKLPKVYDRFVHVNERFVQTLKLLATYLSLRTLKLIVKKKNAMMNCFFTHEIREKSPITKFKVSHAETGEAVKRQICSAS